MKNLHLVIFISPGCSTKLKKVSNYVRMLEWFRTYHRSPHLGKNSGIVEAVRPTDIP